MKHEILKKIEGKNWEDALNKAFDKKNKDVKIDGFRKGKCPRDVYEKKFGKESLFMDAVELVIDKVYIEALKESNLMPIVQPTMDIKNISDKGVELEFSIITKPEIKIKKYTGLKIKKDKVEINKEDITKEIEKLKKQFSELVIKNTAIENGDVAIINFEGFKDDVAFEGGKGENYPLEIGSNTFIPGFEEQLMGSKTGDKTEVKVSFPKDYPSEDLKGKEVIFKVEVLEVKSKEERELDESFFEDLQMDVNSKEELEEKIKSNLTKAKENEVENKFIDNILDEIVKHTKIELLPEIVNEELNRMMDEYNQRLQMQGITLEDFLKFSKKELDTFKDELRPEATRNIKFRYVVEEIKNLEKTSVSDKEVEEELKNMSESYGMNEEEFLKASGGKEFLKYDLEIRKTLDFLKNNN